MIGDALAMLNGWIKGFGLLDEGWRVGIIVFALVFGTAAVAYIASHVIGALEQKFSKTKNLWDDAALRAARKPVVAFVWLQGVYWAAQVAHHYSEAEIFKANDVVLQVGFIWIIVWAILGFVKEVEAALVSPIKTKTPMDYTTVNAISKLARVVVIVTALLIALQSLGYSISGVLAFGGVGGIAVGFAAKDLLANFFGGFIIHLDRPFKVGDWIRSPDRNIEGSVEHIGWRLTTIRTFDQRPLYVPNATFTTIAVENPSRMFNRRLYETIGIRFADVRQMSDIVSDIRSMLENHDEIETKRTLIVNFSAITNTSLDIMIYAFTKTTQWAPFHEIKQDILLKISAIIEGHGAEVAIPSRSLYLPGGVRVAGEGGSANESGKKDNPGRTPETEHQEESGDLK